MFDKEIFKKFGYGTKSYISNDPPAINQTVTVDGETNTVVAVERVMSIIDGHWVYTQNYIVTVSYKIKEPKW